MHVVCNIFYFRSKALLKRELLKAYAVFYVSIASAPINCFVEIYPFLRITKIFKAFINMIDIFDNI